MGKVTVFLPHSDQGHVFTGNYDAGVTPGNCLIISELVPDMMNQNKGNPMPKIRTIYNPDAWAQVAMSDTEGDNAGVDTDPVDTGEADDNSSDDSA